MQFGVLNRSKMQTTNQENSAVDDLQERLRSNVESIQMLNHQVINLIDDKSI